MACRKSLAIFGAAVMLPLSAWAGTPKEEADRCTRYLAALAQSDTQAAAAAKLEHFKPGEVPKRWVRTLQAADETFVSNVKKRGGVKAIEVLPDYINPTTGDVIRREKWTDGMGAVSFVACASFPGKDNPWELEAVVGKDDALNIAGLSKFIETGEKDSSWTQPRPIP